MDDRWSFERELRELFADREVRRAKLPLNMKAVVAADNIFYSRHKDLVVNGKRIPLDPNDPKQGSLRSEWMDLYLANGGELEGGSAGLSITVVDDSGIALEGASVAVQGVGTRQAGYGGTADFGVVPPGSYSVSADASGYEEGTRSVLVKTGESKNERITLVRIRAAPVGDQASQIVYLTFDDGPWTGTQEVYRLLVDMMVRGTFFCTGENADYSERVTNPGLFREMYNNPLIQIANHSHTHGHQFYKTYYDTGLRINEVTKEPDAECLQRGQDGVCTKFKNPGLWRSVLMDFEYAGIAFAAILAQRPIPRPTSPPHDFRGILTAVQKSAYPRFLESRMPGTNIWRLPGIQAQYGDVAGTRVDEAEDLFLNGYRIYGWDTEWKMTFESAELIQNDFYDGGSGRINLIRLAGIDRPKTGFGPNNMFQIVRARFAGAPDPTTGISQLHKRNRLILLMHERAFRHYGSGSDKSKYLDYLRSFITSCRNAGYLFDFVANY